ncbi:MAG: symmetrical bis(5'-nucleosyl)-tetraphosphatase [Gammaproteobacteria bacterium]|uniref:symmetrical bis(5'-nucleosyl)-tetraphosphatase n=1 Tax=Rhodoferax sp. TaxID=50421 RepID=UPI00184C0BAA|nr:symmetrical bis(5'-nucleosyl)-tetraphosphatase [Rhodoferax sp.]MBU3898829.1 symmetrical bis(5'-nucleosyl)-tetraphosphatase [Gammaproteobacteria bacterium]MBA3059451.1 symmetrical bis(5'-nucleosyl)-tetraphosphatase [Rhodoferax sp.]MBU3999020.1 symmetrical bis(5'-nucleosyl)-tetraphosphatase [Gammaproteobacteria bacterium]MBU4019305.1 symmetrical bis(5'-nucleosyl)-tetraphosphatase [Gammaproteobacteria bacterium]MBU4081869.1 symmetrical bis(5'-nucleosyl)-tetraphosphatase [Gammaproteobacteria ba
MALYLIGDVQGCNSALQRLLDKISFSPSRDTLFLLGDLVNRGPDSAGVLRRLMGYGAAAQCLLGNHDLHLLAVAHGGRKPGRKDTLQDILEAPDRQAMLDWLRWQRMAILEQVAGHEVLMVHAGVLPSWTATQTMALAKEVESVLRSPALGGFLQQMYGNQPDHWDETLTGTDRLRVIVNALTRLRFCTPTGHMDYAVTGGVDAAPPGYLPWFEVPERQTSGVMLAFGHWSTLGWLGRPDVLSLDTGCVWGGALSALQLESVNGQLQQALVQVQCQQAQKPG